MSEVSASRHAERVAAHYDGLDPVFRAIWGESLHHGLWEEDVECAAVAAERMSAWVGRLLDLRVGERLLDVGCGYGRMAADLARRFRVEATGVTVSEKQRDQAVEGVEVRLGDWLENGLDDEQFDAVMAIESLEHMPDPGRAVAEMARVLRPGGRVVLCCWLTCEHMQVWERRLLVEPIRRDGMLVGMSDESAVRRWLDSAGLEVGRPHDLSRQVERTWSDALWRACGLIFVRPEFRRQVIGEFRRSWRMAMTLQRTRLAYAIGCLRYVVFIAQKSG